MTFNPDAALKNFPCSFNLIPDNRVSRQRLKHVKHNLESDIDDGHKGEEEIRNKNLLSWVLFSLDKKQDAMKLNDEVLTLTNRRNIVSLGNLIYISCRRGWQRKAEDEHFKELQSLQSDEDFHQLVLVARAEQAYSYSRIGGLENSKLCINLFKECTEKCPENYIWKFGLGLTYRRLTNCNFHCSSPEKINLKDVAAKCAETLLEVAEKGDDRFKGLAYAQLVNLKQSLRGEEYKHLFNNLTIWQLKDKALQFGDREAAVLAMCGKSFKSVDIDESIALLERSLHLRKNGIAYHHLGLSLMRKADLIANGNYRNKSGPKSGPGRYGKARRQLSFDSASPESFMYTTTQQTTNAPFSRHRPNRYSKASWANRNSMHRYPVKDFGYNKNQPVPTETRNCASQEVQGPEKDNFPKSQLRYTQRPASDYLQTSVNCDMRAEKKNSHRPFVQKSKSVPETSSPYTNATLKHYVKSPFNKIDKDNKLIKEAIQCFEKSIQVTHEQNIPAMFSLGKAFFESEQYDEALAQCNQIIDQAEGSYILTLINAHELAGMSLQNLKQHPEKSGKLFEQPKEHFTKAIGLAADMVSRNPNFENCETEVWESLKILRNDVENWTEPKHKTKEIFKLLELVKKYGDIVDVADKMIETVWDDIESFQTLLNSHLIMGNYEEALVCLNMASTKSGLKSNELWSSPNVMEMKARTYIGAGWSRLIKSCSDTTRVFQQLFQMKYGGCAGMDRGDSEHDQHTDGRDILLVNDETADDECGPDITTTLACNLSQVFNVLFGADTFRNLMVNFDFTHGAEESQLQEMKNYKLALLVLGDNDSPIYDLMLEAVHLLSGPKIMVLNLRKCKDLPEILKRNKILNADDVIWQQTKLLSTSSQASRNVEPSVREVVDTLLDGNTEAAMRLFCFLVEEDFEKHRGNLKLLAEKSDSNNLSLESSGSNEDNSRPIENVQEGIVRLKL